MVTMYHPRGHSNVRPLEFNGPFVHPDDARGKARIGINGGATLETCRPLPDLFLTREEWAVIGRAMKWSAVEPPKCPDNHRLAFWFTPEAVREHIAGDEGVSEDEACPDVTDDELSEAARGVVSDPSDLFWTWFDNAMHTILDDARR